MGIFQSGAQVVLKWARETPRAVAVVQARARITYGEMAEDLAKLAAMLASRGVRPGMIVGLRCDDRYQLLALQLACEVVGAAHVCLARSDLPPESPEARGCQVFIVERPQDELAALGLMVELGGGMIAEVLQAPMPAEGVALLEAFHGPDVGVRVGRTSGTTGRPKLMLKTRANVIAEARIREGSTVTLGSRHRYLAAYSTSMASVYLDVMRTLCAGGCVCFVNGWGEFFEVADGDAISTALVRDAETIVRASAERGQRLSLAYLSVIGGFLSDVLHERLKERISPLVFNAYSSNETGRVANRVSASLYSVLPGVGVEVVDEDGMALPMGAPGRIRVRSPALVEGYLWDEALTARQFRDGWFVMSDLGRIPEPGKLAVLGRVDDMLDVGGVKIAPEPIERALRAIAGVDDAVLIRLETAYGVGVMCTVIERRRPGNDEALIRAAVVQVARPGETSIIHLERELPRTETGKVRRGMLAERMGRIYGDHLSGRPPQAPVKVLGAAD